MFPRYVAMKIAVYLEQIRIYSIYTEVFNPWCVSILSIRKEHVRSASQDAMVRYEMKAFNLITKQLVEALSDHTHMEDTEVDQETHKTEKKD